MARVTVEDCVLRVPNRFELVMLASQRARDLSQGAAPTIDKENDKNPVIALREIADETVELGALRNNLIHGMQKQVEVDEPEEESALTLPVGQEAESALAEELASFHTPEPEPEGEEAPAQGEEEP